MKDKVIKVALSLPTCLVFSGCMLWRMIFPDFDSLAEGFEDDIKNATFECKWHVAERIVDEAFDGWNPEEKNKVDDWKARERQAIKLAFVSNLGGYVSQAKEKFFAGDIEGGNNIRIAMKDRYIGGSAKVDEVVSPELQPCVELAMAQMQSDCSVAQMKLGFESLLKRIKDIDPDGALQSIREMDAIREEYKKLGTRQKKIDVFMDMLVREDVWKWAPINRAKYSATMLKPVYAIRDQVVHEYLVKRWRVRVHERRADYRKVRELVDAGKFQDAMRILSSHDVLVCPETIKFGSDFDDYAERMAVTTGKLGEEIVRQLVETGLSGVQYHRKCNNGISSLLVIGRKMVDGGDVKDKRQLRKAGRAAQMLARSELAKFMNVLIESVTESDLKMVDGASREEFVDHVKQQSKTALQELVVIATAVDNGEVVCIMGWRDPTLGTITPAPMHRVQGDKNFTVSPSAGAYL